MRKIKKERVLSSERKDRNHSGGNKRRRKKVCKITCMFYVGVTELKRSVMFTGEQ